MSGSGVRSADSLNKNEFGKNFKWGVSVSAYQIEGAHEADGKGHSIWDIFSNTRGKIHQQQNGNVSCNFYNTYCEDLLLMKSLNIPNFRFSLSWPRLFPNGHLPANSKGIAYYDRLIDKCLEFGIEPWITLYHWDLPHEIEMKGGWINRNILNWFLEYVDFCGRKFGDRVKYWMVLNEPMVFTGAGYFLGIHAPGKKGLKNFLPAMHHATLCQAQGGKVLKDLLPKAEIGTTFSSSYIEPYRDTLKDNKAAVRVDALLNRLFIEPSLGMGYPLKDLPALKSVEKYMWPDDEKLMKFDFDFVGVQNYTREVVRYSLLTPYLQAQIVKASKRKVPITLMNWEVYPPSIYHILKKYAQYNLKKIYVTESGAAFNDNMIDGMINDSQRLRYIKDHISEIKKAKDEGVKVEGYFIWSFTDNFEWAEGFLPRFGIVYIDFETQKRTVKASGQWYREFLSK